MVQGANKPVEVDWIGNSLGNLFDDANDLNKLAIDLSSISGDYAERYGDEEVEKTARNAEQCFKGLDRYIKSTLFFSVARKAISGLRNREDVLKTLQAASEAFYFLKPTVQGLSGHGEELKNTLSAYKIDQFAEKCYIPAQYATVSLGALNSIRDLWSAITGQSNDEAEGLNLQNAHINQLHTEKKELKSHKEFHGNLAKLCSAVKKVAQFALLAITEWLGIELSRATSLSIKMLATTSGLLSTFPKDLENHYAEKLRDKNQELKGAQGLHDDGQQPPANNGAAAPHLEEGQAV